jgi:5-methylcytosine-specific restriction protein A
MPWRPVSPRRPDTRPGSTARGYGSQWQRTRAAYLRRHPDCAVCGYPATHVHHVERKRDGGPDDWANLMALCAPHHNAISARGG